MLVFHVEDRQRTYRIAMAVTNDLVTDRRVLRHAETLREAGYEVVLIGVSSSVKSTPNCSLLTTHYKKGWRFYLEFNVSLRRRLMELKPDAVWANDTDTLLGCWMAASKLRKPLVMDAHELFPEVPEIQRKPFVKWVWRTIERCLMPKCDALLTVCDSIAAYYKEKYGVEMAVVRNLPACGGNLENPGNGFDKISQDFDGSNKSWKSKENLEDLKDSHNFAERGGEEKMLLYQGKVNVGRGVDWAIDALEWLEDCRLVVAGDGDLLEEMKAYAKSKPWCDRIEFLGRMKPEEMETITPKADVGLVMLEDMGLSYHFALPNRIGDFVAAGVPMVVSDLPEMAAVVRKFGGGEVMYSSIAASRRSPYPKIGEDFGRAQANALAEAVRKVLARGKENYYFAAAREEMDWIKEKVKLINIAVNCKL